MEYCNAIDCWFSIDRVEVRRAIVLPYKRISRNAFNTSHLLMSHCHRAILAITVYKCH